MADDPPEHHGELEPRGHRPGEHGRLPARLRLLLIVGPIVALVVAANVGDALAPQLVDRHPLVLILLNARNRNLLAVSNELDPWSFYVVGSLRLLISDPPFYFLGYFYGDAAVQWIEQRTPTIGRYARQFEEVFSYAAYPLVAIMPNNFICLFAGSAGMRPAWFVSLNVAGTLGRLYLLRVLGDVFEEPIDDVIGFIGRNRLVLTMVSVGIVALSVLNERRSRRGTLEELEELIDEGGDEPSPG